MNKTFIDVLRAQAEYLEERIAYRFLVNGKVDGVVESISYASLEQRAKAIAVMLADQDIRGERVLLLYPPGLAFIEGFFGVLFAGAIPVPIQLAKPGEQQGFSQRLEAIARDSQALFVVSTDPHILLPSWLKCFNTEDALLSSANLWRDPQVNTEDIAFLQYTSGSTRQPQGVRITHTNLLANCQAITNAGFGHGEESLLVNWMPPYHDMGLIGGILYPLYSNLTTVMLSPQSFLREPLRWLQAISHFQATSSGGPNFAFALAIQRSTEQERSQLNLSHWQAAYCGAEPIKAEVLMQFADTFASCGFNKKAFLPCYGMAESTLFVTGKSGFKTFDVDRQQLALHHAEQSNSIDAKTLVSCGQTTDNTQVHIVEPTTMKELPERHVGEIWIKGDSVSKGYFHEQNDDPFNVTLNAESGFLRSGDLGFLHDNELYVCGRLKDLIIIRGQNCYPQDIEMTVEDLNKVIVPGCVAAFAVQNGGEESFAVLVGIRSQKLSEDELQSLAQYIKIKIMENHGLEPFALLLVRSSEVPKTSSGKIRRAACRNLWQQGDLNPLIQLGDAPSTHNQLYPKLGETLAKLNRRSTHYRFDIEQDIEWHRINEPGRYFPDSFLRANGFDVEQLKNNPEDLAFNEWALALSICRCFAVFEEAVLTWGKQIQAVDAKTRSFDLLETEEAKHIDVFHRYTEALAQMHPDAASNLQEIFSKTDIGFIESIPILSPDQFQSATEHHYMVWLAILYFEEYTLWVDEVLKELGDEVQPVWQQAHSCHRHEEIQHVITDYGYLKALDTTFEQRRNWSESFFTKIFRYLSQENQKIISCTQDYCFEKSESLTLYQFTNLVMPPLNHRLFVRTRQIAPYAEFLSRPNDDIIMNPRAIEDEDGFRHWLIETVAELLEVDALGITDDASFNQLGLDSLGHFSLASALERKLGYPVSNTITTTYSSVNALMDYFTKIHTSLDMGNSEQNPLNLIASLSEEPISASISQQRFLGYTSNSEPFNIYFTLSFQEPINYQVLTQALLQVLTRHDGLCTAFSKKNDYFVLDIKTAEQIPINILKQRTSDSLETAAHTLIGTWNGRLFDYQHHPLWRLAVIEHEKTGESTFVWLIHHIVCDGWSVEILKAELLENYQALKAGRQLDRPVLSIQASDLTRQEDAFLQSPKALQSLQWWLKHPSTSLAINNYESGNGGNRVVFNHFISLPDKEILQKLAKEHNTTLGVLLLTVFSTIMGKHEGGGYVLTRTHNRHNAEESKLVGFIMDSLLIPKLTDTTNFTEALAQTKSAYQDALAHYLPLQYLTLELMGKTFFQQKRSLGHSINFIPFTEENTCWHDVVEHTARNLSAVAPWFRNVLFIWMLRDGMALSFQYIEGDNAFTGEQLASDFMLELQKVANGRLTLQN